jgi:anti-sigma factor ChrR (cupin superfamily)
MNEEARPLPPEQPGSTRLVLRDLFAGFDPKGLGDFVPLRPGVSILPLYGTPTRPSGGPAAALLRYQPGASVPAHQHPGYEHIFVLEGSQQDERGVYGPGTCLISPPGSHHTVTSESGCLVLAIWNQPVEMLDR